MAGFFLWRYLGSYEGTDDAQIDGHLNAISTRVSGHVIKLLVNDNQYVEAGTPLVEIDPKDYQVAVAKAKAAYQDAVATAQSIQVNVPITSVNTGSQLSSSQAEVESGRAGVSVARQQLEAARAQLEQAIANDIKAQNDVGRYKQLVDKQEISHAAIRPGGRGCAVKRGRSGCCTGFRSCRGTDGFTGAGETRAGGSRIASAETAPQQLSVIRSRAEAARLRPSRRKPNWIRRS